MTRQRKKGFGLGAVNRGKVTRKHIEKTNGRSCYFSKVCLYRFTSVTDGKDVPLFLEQGGYLSHGKFIT